MARVIAWISIALILIGLSGMGGFFWYLHGTTVKGESHAYYLYAAIGTWIIAFLYMVAIFFLWRSLSVSIAIMECASDFVGSSKRSVVVPVAAFLVVLVAFVCWIAGMVCVASIGKIEGDSGGA